MELFAIHCTTCRTRLKVRNMEAIGQILACPKCGGMVQVTPPEGWTPPTEDEAHANDAASASPPSTSTDAPRSEAPQDETSDSPPVSSRRALRLALISAPAALFLVAIAVWIAVAPGKSRAPVDTHAPVDAEKTLAEGTSSDAEPSAEALPAIIDLLPHDSALITSIRWPKEGEATGSPSFGAKAWEERLAPLLELLDSDPSKLRRVTLAARLATDADYASMESVQQAWTSPWLFIELTDNAVLPPESSKRIVPTSLLWNDADVVLAPETWPDAFVLLAGRWIVTTSQSNFETHRLIESPPSTPGRTFLRDHWESDAEVLAVVEPALDDRSWVAAFFGPFGADVGSRSPSEIPTTWTLSLDDADELRARLSIISEDEHAAIQIEEATQSVLAALRDLNATSAEEIADKLVNSAGLTEDDAQAAAALWTAAAENNIECVVERNGATVAVRSQWNRAFADNASAARLSTFAALFRLAKLADPPAVAEVEAPPPEQPDEVEPGIPEIPKPRPREPLAPRSATEVEQALAAPLVGMEFVDAPLPDVVELFSQLSSLPVTLDVDSIAARNIDLRAPVTAKVNDATIVEALKQVLGPRGLTLRFAGDQLIVEPANADDAIVERRYDLAPFAGGNEELLEWTETLVRDVFIASDPGVEARLSREGAVLIVAHDAAGHLRLRRFFESWQSANAPAAGNRNEAPVVANFQTSAPLVEILRYLEQPLQTHIVVDHARCAAAGVAATEEVVLLSADKPARAVLAQLLTPLGLAYRDIEDGWIEVTSRAGAWRSPEVRYYSAADLSLDNDALEGRLRAFLTSFPPAVGEEAVADTIWQDVKHDRWLVVAPPSEHYAINAALAAAAGMKAEPSAAPVE